MTDDTAEVCPGAQTDTIRPATIDDGRAQGPATLEIEREMMLRSLRIARRGRVLAPLMVLLLAAATLAAPPAGAKPRLSAVAIESTFDDGGFITNPDGLACSGTDPHTCEMQFHGASTTAGTLHGSETYRIWFYPGPDGSPASRAYETFTGTIDGCGTGSLDFTLKNVQPAPNPLSAPALIHFDGDWEVVAGSGTGGLAGVSSGQGQEHGDMAVPTTANTGQFVGTIVCRPAR